MLIFDLHYIGWRAFHCMGHLKTSGNAASGLVLGALQQIRELSSRFKDRPIVFACDSPISKRQKICPSYKANRVDGKETEQEREAREEAQAQIVRLKTEVLPRLGFRNIFQFEGYEADDIIAALALLGHYPYIITNDDDLLQLLDMACIYSPSRKMVFDKEWLIQEKGVLPTQWPRIKAIAGCPSDNVQGVRGVGEIIALRWLHGQLKPGKKLNAINEFLLSEAYPLNMKLVSLPFDEELALQISPNEFSVDGFREVCRQYEFQQLLKQEKEWAATFNERERTAFRRKENAKTKQGFGI